jgi:hypothetical protein
MARADPFYIVKSELSDQVGAWWGAQAAGKGRVVLPNPVVNECCLQLNEVEQRLSRFHGLVASNPERKEIAKSVETECNSMTWQVRAGRMKGARLAWYYQAIA